MRSADVLSWLLEVDNPSARYLALTRVLDRSEDDAEVLETRSRIPDWDGARAILAAQWPEGYWMRPGIGYSPKYKATVWQVIFLAALGAPRTQEVDRACTYVLDHGRLADGRFTAYKTARGAVACLNGNLLRAMFQLGCQDPRLAETLEALTAMAVRDGFCCRFNAPRGCQNSPPARMGDGLPCAWGAIKALGAFAEVPARKRPASVQAAVEAGVALLLNGDLATGDYPSATGPSPLWRRFGFPLGYASDLLEALQVLGRLGVGPDLRLAPAVEVVRSKRREDGRWLLGARLENTWFKVGRVGQPSKWVTLRALEVLTYWES